MNKIYLMRRVAGYYFDNFLNAILQRNRVFTLLKEYFSLRCYLFAIKSSATFMPIPILFRDVSIYLDKIAKLHLFRNKTFFG